MLYKCVRSSCKIPILVTSLKNKELLSKDQTTYTLQTSKVNHYGIINQVNLSRSWQSNLRFLSHESIVQITRLRLLKGICYQTRVWDPDWDLLFRLFSLMCRVGSPPLHRPAEAGNVGLAGHGLDWRRWLAARIGQRTVWKFHMKSLPQKWGTLNQWLLAG